MHAATFQRWFLCLATVAVLLVVLAPLISRSMHHPPAAAAALPAALPAHAHAAMPGHAHAAPDAHAHHEHHAHPATAAPAALPPATPHEGHSTPAADPHAGHEMGVECDYCLIAARMLAFLVLLVLALAPQAARAAVRGAMARGHGAAPFSRLGARGPPRLA